MRDGLRPRSTVARMSTVTHHSSAVLVAALALLASALAAGRGARPARRGGRAISTAGCRRRSSSPRASRPRSGAAELRAGRRGGARRRPRSAKRVRVQLFQVGPEPLTTRRQQRDAGRPGDRRIATSTTAVVPIRIGDWPRGLYFARLAAADGRVGFAPFVLRPRELGEQPRGRRPADAHLAGLQPPRRRRGRQAGDTWYADWKRHTARARPPVPEPRRPVPLPPLRPAVPPLARPERARHVDVLTDADLDGAPERRRTRRRLRPHRLPGPPRVRDDARVRPSSATATSAATSRSSRPTTSSGRS